MRFLSPEDDGQERNAKNWLKVLDFIARIYKRLLIILGRGLKDRSKYISKMREL